MARDWESWLATASGPASPTEERDRDRTEKRIKDAIRAASDLPSSVRVYVKGSYANNTNVRGDADVDVAVEWTETAKVKKWDAAEGLSAEELGINSVTPSMTTAEFRRRVERAVSTAFGSSAVDTSPDKHIGVAASASTLDADVVPCWKLHRYGAPGRYVVGHRLFPKSGGTVDNYPKQNYDNGVAKNNATGKRYKEIVRCVKRLAGELHDDGLIPREYPGYLIECLVFNVPEDHFGHRRRYDDVQAAFRYLSKGLRDEDIYFGWHEPSRLKMLFRGRPDRIPRNALKVITQAAKKLENG
jgi:hypothetical protein